MDRETILQQFNVIENKISGLVDKCQQLETTNAELLNKIELLNSQLEDKLAAERQNEEIKSLVISKIDGLMGRLNEFTGEQ